MLPQYVSACDILLFPVNTSVHAQNTISLKIFETLALGKPIVATRALVTNRDYKKRGGVVWAGSDLDSFLAALVMVHDNYSAHASLAHHQALNFRDYSIEITITRIVEQVRKLCSN